MRLTFLLLSCAAALQAQQPAPPAVEIRDLRSVPRDVADEVQQVFNATSTRRVSGDVTVGASETVTGDLAVMAGQVIVAGQVTGRVVVINGAVVVRSAARVGGSAIAIGATVTTIGAGILAGSVSVAPAAGRGKT